MDHHSDDAEAREKLRRVAACWDRTTESRRETTAQGWLDSYYVASTRLNQRVSGDRHLNWLEGLVQRLDLPTDGRWLSIGCGAGNQEIDSAKQGLFSHLLGIDLSPASLDAARVRAKEEGVETEVEFVQGDFVSFDPPESSYDVVFMNMALHHVEELDGLFERILPLMGPKSYFLIHEYVGPRQFQFPDHQLAIVRALLHSLPEELRIDSTTGKIKQRYDRRPVEFWNEVDPSESIRSDLIVPKLYQYFEVVDRIDYGGTILHLLLEHIVHNFDPGNPGHCALLDLLGGIEDLLIDRGVLGSDFTIMAMKAKHRPDAEMDPSRQTPVEATVSRREVEFLRSGLRLAQDRLETVESSFGWRLIQGLRGLLGRRW